jgi:hypothetical protein
MNSIDKAGSSRSRIFQLLVPILALALIAGVTYGLMIKFLGFYWDDWPHIWIYHFHGPQGLWDYVANDRPLSGLFYALFFRYLGISPTGWHVLALLLRLLGSIVIFLTFRALRQQGEDRAWLIALFVLIYPGFSQQAIGLTYVGLYASFLLFALSLYFTLRSLCHEGACRQFFTAISLLSVALAFAMYEHFVGLELLRLLIIYVALRPNLDAMSQSTTRLKIALIKWIPYATVLFIYGIWRLFFFHAFRETMNSQALLHQIMLNPFSETATRVLSMITNIFMATVMAWSRTITPDLLTYTNSKSVVASWLVGGAAAAIGMLTLTYFSKRSASGTTDVQNAGTDSKAGALGALALVCGGIPLFLADRRINYDILHEDRYSLPFILGAALTLAWIVGSIGRTRFQKQALVATILFLFASFQFRIANDFRKDWNSQKSLIWQLAWRAPDLKPDTAIFAAGLPPRSLYESHVSGLADLLYHENRLSHQFDLFVFDLDSERTSHSAPILEPNEPLTGLLRNFEFHGNTSNALVICNPARGSLRTVDRDRLGEDFMLPASCRAVRHLSDVTGTIRDKSGLPGGPLLTIVGPEPAHEWPYYFQRAQFERQFGRWDAVSRLKEQALREGYRPEDSLEWLPFIEADVMTHHYDAALRETHKVLADQPDSIEALTLAWRRIGLLADSKDPDLARVIDSLRAELRF